MHIKYVNENSITIKLRRKQRIQFEPNWGLQSGKQILRQSWALFLPVRSQRLSCISVWHTDILHKGHGQYIIQVNTYKVSSKSPWTPTELGKKAILRSYISSLKRKKTKTCLYGWTGTPIFGELWLTYNADTLCTLWGENSMFNFFLVLPLKYKFYIIKYNL